MEDVLDVYQRPYNPEYPVIYLYERIKQESLTADELVAYLVDAEWDDRQERKTTRLMKTAAFRARATFPEVDRLVPQALRINLAGKSMRTIKKAFPAPES